MSTVNSAKVSFAINEKEGLAELRRRQVEAGASSLGLYVKQLVREHLAHDGDDAIAQLTDSVEHLRSAVLQLASRQTDMMRQQGEDAIANPAMQMDDLRRCLKVMFVTLLQHRSPMSLEQAKKVIRETLGDAE